MPYADALTGGLLIGFAAGTLLLTLGRIAGISGIFGRFLFEPGPDRPWRGAFVVGLLLAPITLRTLIGYWPTITHQAPLPLLALAGVIVGYGTQLGNGCTSGHGICGLSNGSGRSLVAVLTFMAVAIVVTYIVRHLLGVHG